MASPSGDRKRLVPFARGERSTAGFEGEAVTATPGPLEGLRVLETASLYAAPLLATFLADQGAEVTKVEPPGGDPYRSWPALWALVGRRKRSLTLDLALPEGQALLRRLLPHFDVVVENLPRRVAEKRGLTYEQMAAINPALVVVTATGFGHDGPYAGRPANGTLSEAFAGLTYLTGDPDGPPMLPSVPLGDVVAASFGATGVLAACMRQARTGLGGHVDLTAYEPMLHVIGPALSGQVPGASAPQRTGGRAGAGIRGTFQAADGQWVAVGCSNDEHERRLLELVGPAPSDAGSDDDRVRAWIATLTRPAVLAALVGQRVPGVPVNDVNEVLADPHVEARSSVVAVVGKELPPGAKVAAPTPRLDGVEPTEAVCPELGDANRALLSGTLGLTDEELGVLQQQGVIGE
ncbi:MAG: putative Formyl-CoA transferase [Acidimicrobiia bacterium]|nr:putative Formyl-CoA transferase [Acidimicrobiia bacterium]